MRTVRDAKLETRTARLALKRSGKPYWRALDAGQHVGYRKGKTGGKWCSRIRTASGYVVGTIGAADDTADADGQMVLNYSQAQARVREVFAEWQRAAAGQPCSKPGPLSVRDAMNEYLAWLEEHRKSARSIRWTAEASILPELGDKQCTKLTTDEIRRWQEKVAKEPARLRTKPGQKQRYREVEPEDREEEKRRRRATANGKLRIFKAAMNMAWRSGKVSSDAAWRVVKPYRATDVARSRYLTIAEAQRLINAADPDLRDMIKAGLLTGCRYAELAALVAADLNPDAGTLHIKTSKSGKGRHVVLTEEGIEFFRGLAAVRSSKERLLVKANGGRWLKSHQHRPMRDACMRANIDPPVGIHALRHTWASLAIMNGAPLIVVARNLGHADTRMVERHYGHLAPNYVSEAIRAAAPRFGISSSSNVVPIA